MPGQFSIGANLFKWSIFNRRQQPKAFIWTVKGKAMEGITFTEDGIGLVEVEMDGGNFTPPPLTGIGAEEFEHAKISPPCIVENYLFADLALVSAAGGTGKTTTLIYEAVHIATRRDLWVLTVFNPSATLFVTVDDSRELFIARLREVMAAMNLTPYERQLVMQRINVRDVSGELVKLAAIGPNGNIIMTGLPDSIVDAYRDNPPVMIVFRPLR